MITFIEGIIAEKHPTRIVINVNGIGYEILIPLSSHDRLPSEGEQTRILTHFHVREDAQVLYGFLSEQEREMFLMLLSISGIGPKIALSALSGLTPSNMRTAILEGDVKRLSSISGIGKKMAERMVVELKDKFKGSTNLGALFDDGSPSAEQSSLRDATSALVALGYKQEAAEKMLEKIPNRNELSVEDLVRKSLTGR